MRKDSFITSYGLFSTIVSGVIGISVFSYASELSTTLGSNAWIAIILSAIISYIIMYMIFKTIEKNQYDDFNTIMKNSFGKIIGTVLILGFLAYNLIFISVGLRNFIEEIKSYLLEATPTEFLILVTLLAISYLIRDELTSLIKFNEVSFWISFIPVTIIIIFALYNADFSNALPIIGKNNVMDYGKSIYLTFSKFKGIELLFLAVPFMRNNPKIKRVLSGSIIFIALFYIYIVMLSIIMFSSGQVKIMLWPGITMVKSITIPGAFIERWEGIIMAIWVLFFFTTFSNTYYFSANILKDIIKVNDVKIASLILLPIVYIISLYPQNILELIKINEKIIPPMSLIYMVIVPIVLFIITMFKKRSKRRI